MKRVAVIILSVFALAGSVICYLDKNNDIATVLAVAALAGGVYLYVTRKK
jgi:uncharacterized membrane-anchored protein